MHYKTGFHVYSILLVLSIVNKMTVHLLLNSMEFTLYLHDGKINVTVPKMTSLGEQKRAETSHTLMIAIFRLCRMTRRRAADGWTTAR